MLDLGGVFRPFGGLMGTPGVTAGEDGLLGRGLGPRMRWMDCLANFRPLRLDLTAWKLARGKWLIWGLFSVLLGV